MTQCLVLLLLREVPEAAESAVEADVPEAAAAAEAQEPDAEAAEALVFPVQEQTEAERAHAQRQVGLSSLCPIAVCATAQRCLT